MTRSFRCVGLNIIRQAELLLKYSMVPYLILNFCKDHPSSLFLKSILQKAFYSICFESMGKCFFTW